MYPVWFERIQAAVAKVGSSWLQPGGCSAPLSSLTMAPAGQHVRRVRYPFFYFAKNRQAAGSRALRRILQIPRRGPTVPRRARTYPQRVSSPLSSSDASRNKQPVAARTRLHGASEPRATLDRGYHSDPGEDLLSTEPRRRRRRPPTERAVSAARRSAQPALLLVIAATTRVCIGDLTRQQVIKTAPQRAAPYRTAPHRTAPRTHQTCDMCVGAVRVGVARA